MAAAQAQTADYLTDGPYVFYRQGTVATENIVTGGTAKRQTAHFPEKEKTNRLLQVHLDRHPDWDFTVRLKDSIRPTPSETAGADHYLLLSDIEGEFEPFRNLLLAAKVIDNRYRWTFGKGKLVVAGDLFDRGRQVCQFLWLLYKLEDEAALKGGAVEVILGNHDLMNLSGDLRYVDPAYLASAALIGKPYTDLYAADTELGRWLKSKNTIEKIGDLLVTHGGVSPAVLNKRMKLADINSQCRPYYDSPPQDLPDQLKVFFGQDALFWYRGYFLEPLATQEIVDSTLFFYGCKKIVVGHDIVDHAGLFYENKVVAVDVNEHDGVHEAILIANKNYYRMNDKGDKIKLAAPL
ncbi:metallophosphoesterase [Mucilaginibacter sp. UR6-11]|uniref:metallophosphoesterase n=1 Tax=Mucilaginibacter sp. UR6-11 TaxID=1435644 RepID=UPI001E2E7841|nr:metallophosphoesterase [Mucilaginibacter sp. UR6-11]MCC8426475.1 metallophosphoesterase [Mucilaginibacter sp. UR6-11]